MSEASTEQRLTRLETELKHIDQNMVRLVSTSERQIESSIRLSISIEGLTKETAKSNSENKEHGLLINTRMSKLEDKLDKVDDEVKPLLTAFQEFTKLKTMLMVSILGTVAMAFYQVISSSPAVTKLSGG